MNKRPSTGVSLERSLAAELERLLGNVAWLPGVQLQHEPSAKGARFDFLATLPLPGGGKAALCVECKSEVRPAAFVARASRAPSPPVRHKLVVPVLALPWVSPRLAELCAKHGWSWFDLAGNHRLDIPGLLHLHHTGNAPIHERPRPAANLGTREASRIVRALLLPEHGGRRWTQREMQAHCEPSVSLGLVNKVVRHLREEALLDVADDGGFRLSRPLELLSAWRDAYRFDRHDRRGYFSLLQGRKLSDALARFALDAGGRTAYASFSAADIQAPHVRQPKTWLFVRDRDLESFEERVEAKPVDSGENLTVLIPDDEGVFYASEGESGGRRIRCTNLVQTYADLCSSGGRGEEAAEALLEQRLKPGWRERGLRV